MTTNAAYLWSKTNKFGMVKDNNHMLHIHDILMCETNEETVQKIQLTFSA
jgi:hypothetical protein